MSRRLSTVRPISPSSSWAGTTTSNLRTFSDGVGSARLRARTARAPRYDEATSAGRPQMARPRLINHMSDPAAHTRLWRTCAPSTGRHRELACHGEGRTDEEDGSLLAEADVAPALDLVDHEHGKRAERRDPLLGGACPTVAARRHEHADHHRRGQAAEPECPAEGQEPQQAVVRKEAILLEAGRDVV